MNLNLPILDQLADSQSILIAGAGGGFDVFAGLPIYFTLKDMGKTVHLANFSFTDFPLAEIVGTLDVVIETLLAGAVGKLGRDIFYYPEGYLAQWFAEQGEDVPVWMFARMGVVPLRKCYETLVEKLNLDAIILVDGGVDSLMRGNEEGMGTILEDSISLAAVEGLDVPVKLLASIGFGTEVEEAVCHYHALDNMAALIKMGAFRGSCALAPQMWAFQQYERACRYVWEQPNHSKSHISTRIIPAANGEFGGHQMYPDDGHYGGFISPLMALYWFFDATAVAQRNLIIDLIRETLTADDARQILMRYWVNTPVKRRRQTIPY